MRSGSTDCFFKQNIEYDTLQMDFFYCFIMFSNDWNGFNSKAFEQISKSIALLYLTLKPVSFSISKKRKEMIFFMPWLQALAHLCCLAHHSSVLTVQLNEWEKLLLTVMNVRGNHSTLLDGWIHWLVKITIVICNLLWGGCYWFLRLLAVLHWMIPTDVGGQAHIMNMDIR